MYFEKFRLDGKNALVTGAGQGIGFACAQALSEAGAKVILADLSQERVGRASSELNRLGLKTSAVVMDVSKSDEVERIADHCDPIDILINNAGIYLGDSPAENVSDSHWREHMAVNLDGVFWCCRAFGRRMLERQHGVIVNIGSMSGNIVNQPQPQSFYNVTKAAVHHLTRSLAAEWADRNVRVNAVAPTYIETALTKENQETNAPMFEAWLSHTPMGRLGRPDEIASVVHFLASDASSLMTGAIVDADGGYSCW